jgi:hypothetical protein
LNPQLKYGRESDAAYFRIRGLPYAYGEDIDLERRVGHASDGTPIGIELLDVSGGVDLDHLPERDGVARLLEKHAIPVLA